MENTWEGWCMPVIPAETGSENQEDHASEWTGQKIRPYFQNNQSKMCWKCVSSGRVAALQVWSLDFKAQYHQKQKKEERNKKRKSFTYATTWINLQETMKS
jgi:hypothetical protein